MIRKYKLNLFFEVALMVTVRSAFRFSEYGPCLWLNIQWALKKGVAHTGRSTKWRPMKNGGSRPAFRRP